MLVAYNYGLNVPTGATVIGVEVRINRRKWTNSGSCKDYKLYLREGSNLDVAGTISNNKAKSTLWGQSYAEPVYGSQWDYWGVSLSPTRVNQYYFGIMFQVIGASSGSYASMYVDSIQMRVHYAYTTDTIAPPVIDEGAGTVTIPTDTEQIGTNLIPYETSSPSFDTKDGIVQYGSGGTSFSNSKYGVATDSEGRKVYFLNGNGDNYQTRIILYYDIQQLKDNYSLATYRFPVTAGQQYTFQFKIKAPVGKRVSGTIEWFNSSFSRLSLHGTNSPTSTDADEWMLLQVTGTAPTGATHCIFTFGTYEGVGLATSGETVYIKDLQFNTGGFKPYTPSRLHITEWKRPGTSGQEALSGRANWTNPQYLSSADWITPNVYLDTTTPNSQGIMGYNWGWNLPSGAVPKGIMSRMMRVSSVNNGAIDGWLAITVSGMSNGSDISGDAVIPTAWQWKTWGGFYNQHGLPSMPTRSQVNSGFTWTYTVTRNGTNSTVHVEELQMRIFYLLEPPRETYTPIEEMFEVLQEDVEMSQAPLTILPSEGDILLDTNPIQLLQQLGYIGLVDLDRGHHYESVSRSNKLLKERAGNAINYSKTGEVEENRNLKINIPSRSIKTLEGLVDLQSIIPVNTVIDLPDNDPYVQRGYGILHELKHERINRARSLCDMEIEYVTKDLFHPLTVDYTVRTTPPFNYELLSNHENGVVYLDGEGVWDIDDLFAYTYTGSPTRTNTSSGVDIALDGAEQCRWYYNDTISGAFDFISKFTYNKQTDSGIDIRLRDAQGNILLRWSIVDDDVVIQCYPNANTQTFSVTTGYVNFTVEMNIDENNMVSVITTTNNGSADMVITKDGFNLGTPVAMKPDYSFWNDNDTTLTPTLKQVAITKKLFTDDADELVRNVICIPASDKSNIPYSFTRLTSEGTLHCYLNPVREILFHINPVTFFNSSVRLMDNNGTQIISPDMVFSNTDTISLENGLFRAEFHMEDNEVQIYGFRYGWEHIATLSFSNMYHIKPLNITPDSVTIKISETTFTLNRGKPFMTVKHPYDDLNVQVSDFTHYWSDNGYGIGTVKEIVSGNEAIMLNGLFYCTMFNDNRNLGLQIIRPNIASLSVNKISKNDETGIGWYNIIPVANETHAQLGIEYMTRSNQEMGLYL